MSKQYRGYTIAEWDGLQDSLIDRIAMHIRNNTGQKTMVAWKVANIVENMIMGDRNEQLENDEYSLALLMQIPHWIRNSGIDWMKMELWGSVIRGHRATYEDIIEEFIPEDILEQE